MTKSNATERVELQTHLQWVPLELLRAPEVGKGQRQLKKTRVDRLFGKGFNPEVMGYPVASDHGDHFLIIDGQARIEALKQWLGDWHGQHVQCRVFKNLATDEEAELFLELNDATTVDAWAKFQNALTAGRATEVDIDRTVRTQGLLVSRQDLDNSISCVSTLVKVYKRSDAVILGRALRVVRDAYGKAGFDAVVIDGISALCQRYNGKLPEAIAVKKLSAMHGGVFGLLNRAEFIRRQEGATKAACVGAAAVEAINRGERRKLVADWWGKE